MLQLCFLIQLNFSICPLSPRRAYLCSAYVQARKTLVRVRRTSCFGFKYLFRMPTGSEVELDRLPAKTAGF